MLEKFRIKAARKAPEIVAHGNFQAEKKNGHYETDNEKFASFLAENYGVESGDPEDVLPIEVADKKAEGGSE